jgi:hypothetical protein
LRGESIVNDQCPPVCSDAFGVGGNHAKLGDTDRDVDLPEIPTRETVTMAFKSQTTIRTKQRIGV